MSLKAILDNLDGLSDEVKGFYEAGDDGKYRLKVDGLEDSSGLKSALQKERDARKALEKAKSEDSSKVSELERKLQEAEDEKLKAEGKTQELAAKQAERMKADADKQVLAERSAREAAEKRAQAFENQVYENHVRAAAAKSGIHPNAVDDAILRANSLFKLGDDGTPVAKDSDGNVIFGKDGKTPLAVSEWLDGMKETAPHWFPAQGGSGSGGGHGGSTSKSLADCKTDDERVAFMKTIQ